MRYRIYSIGELPVLKIHSIGYSCDIIGTTFVDRKNALHLISYVLSGKGVYNGNPISAGQGFLFTPNVSENVYPDESDPLELLWFTSADPNFDSLIPYFNADKETKIFTHDSPPELRKLREFVISDKRNTVNDSKMLEMFFSVFKYHQKSRTSASSPKTAWESYIDFSVNYIKNNYNQDIKVSRLTSLLGVSQPYLYRIFNEAFGKSPKAFISEYRINQAKKFLTETDMTIAEVSASVGYSDSFSFSKAFSKLCGTSPSEYRNIHKATVNP